jgi:hypothetical protein
MKGRRKWSEMISTPIIEIVLAVEVPTTGHP